jgi:hypothetical protein
VEVVQADDSIEISHAAMSIWDAEDQEPISGMSLEGCDHIEVTKNGVSWSYPPASQSKGAARSDTL